MFANHSCSPVLEVKTLVHLTPRIRAFAALKSPLKTLFMEIFVNLDINHLKECAVLPQELEVRTNLDPIGF
jgi:hypothetical protein